MADHNAHNKKKLLIIYDFAIIIMGLFFALYTELRVVSLPDKYYNYALIYVSVNTLLTLLIFWRFKLYDGVREFFGFSEFTKVCMGSIASGVGIMVGIAVWSGSRAVNCFVMYTVFLIIGISIPRTVYLFRRYLGRKLSADSARNRIMLIGAGSAGNILMRELLTNHYSYGKIICCIDDDTGKKGKYLRGVKIEGGRDVIERMADKHMIDEIFITIPSLSPKEMRELLKICAKTSCRVKTLPGFYQRINYNVSVSKLRGIEATDLLAREPVRINLDEIMEYVTGKTVVVTGGGGSIGSELCSQIAGYNPAKLIIIDINENNVYDLQHKLLSKHADLNLVVLIGSVRDSARIESIFETYRPDIVYHAAAHKHVPLMEDSPNEAVKNNLFGTYNTAVAAGKYGVSRFILISSDKAVNPVGVMGATKRLCEMIIQLMNKKYATEFVAVRFGNVLDSSGSVFPLFRNQIKAGGPVTVTHKDVVRFFMTIPEAVSLVLQAGYYAKGGEIFILDMGDPVRIDDMARKLIRLAGYVPDEDIEIQYTGLRPGEKLFEEILIAEEGIRKTDNKLIYIANPIVFDQDVFMTNMDQLKTLAQSNSDQTREKIGEMIRITGA
ncbi:MAG: polysaccharide biosynthesis protein [Oscillospiraceae bacterium]|nr:polysaccharide biosynthesis protein [Oscillospiraceae bacterium]